VKAFVDTDNDQAYFMYATNLTGTAREVEVPEDMFERYSLALLEWDAIQDELNEYYKGFKEVA
jgi:hypothetical protein